jgi:hypothetical protein
MKNTLLKLTLWTGCLIASGWTALAGPLQRADVPADAAWVLHLNCDGLNKTTLGQYLAGELRKPEAQAKLAAFQVMFGFDLQTQLHGLTLYGRGSTPEDGVLLVYADFDANRLVTIAKAAHGYQSTNYGQHVIHNWIDDNKKAKDGVKPRVYAAIQGARVIFGQREASVAAALDVLDSATPNLAGSRNFPQLGAPSNTGFVQGAARKLDLAETSPNAALLKLSKLITLDIGEAQQQVVVTLTLEANGEEVAGHMVTIAQGLVALLKLQADKPEAAKLADALSLKQDGAKLTATLSLPADQLVAVIKADAERKARKNQKKDE